MVEMFMMLGGLMLAVIVMGITEEHGDEWLDWLSAAWEFRKSRRPGACELMNGGRRRSYGSGAMMYNKKIHRLGKRWKR